MILWQFECDRLVCLFCYLWILGCSMYAIKHEDNLFWSHIRQSTRLQSSPQLNHNLRRPPHLPTRKTYQSKYILMLPRSQWQKKCTQPIQEPKSDLQSTRFRLCFILASIGRDTSHFPPTNTLCQSGLIFEIAKDKNWSTWLRGWETEGIPTWEIWLSNR